MAKKLNQFNSEIQNGSSIKPEHILQFANALNGDEIYDLNISGSININGKPIISSENLNGTNYVMVYGVGIPEENAAELQAAYNEAKTMPRYLGNIPISFASTTFYKGQTFYNSDTLEYRKLFAKVTTTSSLVLDDNSNEITDTEAKSTRTTVIVAPGDYSNPTITEVSGIDIRSLTGKSDVLINGVGKYGMDKGTNYIRVYGTGTPSENAAELQAVYNEAKLMLPTVNNIITVIIAPGTYNFGATAFVVNTPYINIVSLTGCSDVIISSTEEDFDYPIIYGIKVIANNVFIKGINCKTNIFYIANNLPNLICEYCIGDGSSFGYENIVSGTFNHCIGGVGSFGTNGTALGTFNHCIAGGSSFGGGGIASGTFNNCIGGDFSFGGEGILTGTLTNCKVTSGTFKTPTGTGKIYNCIDGNGDLINYPSVALQAPGIRKIVFDSTYIYKLTEEDNGATLIADAANMTSAAVVLFDYSALPPESLINPFMVTIVNVGYMNIGYYDGTTLTNLHTGVDKTVSMIREAGPYTYHPFVRILN